MFLELKDGRVVNLDRVSMVEPFNAAAEFYASPFAGMKPEEARKHIATDAHYNARIFVDGAHSREAYSDDNLARWQKIEETPAEFAAKANALRVQQVQEAQDNLVNLIERQLGQDYDGPG